MDLWIKHVTPNIHVKNLRHTVLVLAGGAC